MSKAIFYTLGCRLNQTESAVIAKSLEDIGYQISEAKEAVDLCVINTCTVTNQSDSKCRQSIRAIVKKNPGAIIAVVGCFAQMASDQIKELGGVDIILGNQEKLNLYQYIEQARHSSEPIVKVGAISKEAFSVDTIGQHWGSTRANLKIQDGCDFVCSFCIIPRARGRSRSREIDNIRLEAETLGRAGVKEIVLTGVNVGTFQQDDKGILELIDLFEQIAGIERVRISSIEPTTVDTALFELMRRDTSKLLPYLHLPLQAGSNSVLKAMRRRYSIEEYSEYVRRAETEVPDICIGSDIIVGFPGETDEMFEETLRTLQGLSIHYFHVFPYAERKGTKSEKMGDKVNSKTISRRASILRNLSEQKKAGFAARFVGRSLKVLFESNNKGKIWKGYTENYIRVVAESDLKLNNQIRLVRIVESKNGQVHGLLV